VGATLRTRTDAIVVGGGMFGCKLALDLRRRGLSVVLLEREQALFRRASYNNQARVHNGYHYPRSILTGLRSRVNAARFLAEYADCVDSSFQMYYGIGRTLSNVTAAQFRAFCARIGAPLVPVKDGITALFDSERIEQVFLAEEHAFDAVRLAARMGEELQRERVDVRLGVEALRIAPGASFGADARIGLEASGVASGESRSFSADHVFNCTYSNINGLLSRSGIEKLALKQELAEMALVEVPPILRQVGVTIMCGPFFSFMPFPSRGLHTFSHVRYTPHHAWNDKDLDVDNLAYFARVPKVSHFPFMQKDSQRYMPIVERFVQRGSLWELKTILPQSESDDSRPILFKRDVGLPGSTCVLGGKIDNVYDMESELDSTLVIPNR
jgi:glycine/D-amino acid oxidase-like deaminating enzyme